MFHFTIVLLLTSYMGPFFCTSNSNSIWWAWEDPRDLHAEAVRPSHSEEPGQVRTGHTESRKVEQRWNKEIWAYLGFHSFPQWSLVLCPEAHLLLSIFISVIIICISTLVTAKHVNYKKTWMLIIIFSPKSTKSLCIKKIPIFPDFSYFKYWLHVFFFKE